MKLASHKLGELSQQREFIQISSPANKYFQPSNAMPQCQAGGQDNQPQTSQSKHKHTDTKHILKTKH